MPEAVESVAIAEISRKQLALWLSIFAGVFFMLIGYVMSAQSAMTKERTEDVQRISVVETEVKSAAQTLLRVEAKIDKLDDLIRSRGR